MLVSCDNQAVVGMINNLASSCPQCMFLLRILVLNCLKFNRRIVARYISSRENYLSDALSRGKIQRFLDLAPPSINRKPNELCSLIWPASKIWQEF